MTLPVGVTPRVVARKTERTMRQHSNRPAAPNTVGNSLQLPGGAEIVKLPELASTDCPCGTARRAFVHRDDFDASVHLTEIHQNAQTHYHRRLTETYVVLECGPDAAMELDGQLVPVQPLTSVLIPPGVRHRAVGRMRVVIFCTPTFDPADEFFD